MLSSKNAVARILNAEPLAQNHKVLKVNSLWENIRIFLFKNTN